MHKDRVDAGEAMILEELAAIEHERWAHWQNYLHSKCRKQSDGSLVIPNELVERWERLIKTPYPQLTDEEKASDREQVTRYLPIIKAWLVRQQTDV